MLCKLIFYNLITKEVSELLQGTHLLKYVNKLRLDLCDIWPTCWESGDRDIPSLKLVLKCYVRFESGLIKTNVFYLLWLKSILKSLSTNDTMHEDLSIDLRKSKPHPSSFQMKTRIRNLFFFSVQLIQKMLFFTFSSSQKTLKRLCLQKNIPRQSISKRKSAFYNFSQPSKMCTTMSDSLVVIKKYISIFMTLDNVTCQRNKKVVKSFEFQAICIMSDSANHPVASRRPNSESKNSN